MTAYDNMIDGYLDGFNPNSPEPSGNHSASYRHGFRMGRNDLRNKPGEGPVINRAKAAAAEDEDRNR